MTTHMVIIIITYDKRSESYLGSDDALELVVLVDFVHLLPPAGVVLGQIHQKGVDRDGQTVLHHVPDYPGEQTSRKLQAGVRIYLDQPHFALGVNQKVVAKNFEREHILVSSELVFGRSDTDFGQFSHPAHCCFVVEFL